MNLSFICVLPTRPGKYDVSVKDITWLLTSVILNILYDVIYKCCGQGKSRHHGCQIGQTLDISFCKTSDSYTIVAPV